MMFHPTLKRLSEYCTSAEDKDSAINRHIAECRKCDQGLDDNKVVEFVHPVLVEKGVVDGLEPVAPGLENRRRSPAGSRRGTRCSSGASGAAPSRGRTSR